MQMAILEPDLAILDETDSGLDIDALRIVAQGIREVRKERPAMGIVLITHYQRLLDELQPDVVHILIDGKIVKSCRRIGKVWLRGIQVTTSNI
jgi:Fe-S cluster assembly ATP-binding protein